MIGEAGRLIFGNSDYDREAAEYLVERLRRGKAVSTWLVSVFTLFQQHYARSNSSSLFRNMGHAGHNGQGMEVKQKRCCVPPGRQVENPVPLSER